MHGDGHRERRPSAQEDAWEKAARSRAGSGAQPNGPHFKHALPWGEVLELAVGCAKGVAALAEALPGYSHNDIKSANFLVHREQPQGKVGGKGGGRGIVNTVLECASLPCMNTCMNTPRRRKLCLRRPLWGRGYS